MSSPDELMAAIEAGDRDAVEAALDHGADPWARNKQGIGLIIRFCLANRTREVELLISAGASVVAPYDKDVSLLRIAIEDDYAEMVEMLLGHGAELEEKNPDLLSVFRAVIGDAGRTIPVLAAHGANLELTDNLGRTPLFKAILANKLEAAAAYINAGANVEHIDNEGYRAIHAAAFYNNAAAIRLLAKGGADINIRDAAGFSPLARALAKTAEEAFLALLECGADVNGLNEGGRSLLHYAVKEPVFVKMLLEHGADLEQDDESGFTPLIAAVLMGNLESVRILTEAGANISVRDAYGYTPARLARKQGKREIAEYLDSQSGASGFWEKLFD